MAAQDFRAFVKGVGMENVFIVDFKHRILLILGFCAIFFINACGPPGQEGRAERLWDNSDLKLWYIQPAEKWVEALPVGNGRLGAMIFGGVSRDRIQLNEESLWAGSRINNNNPEALRNLPRIQELLINEKNKEARDLVARTFLGTPPRIRSYQTAGDMFIDFPDHMEIRDYQRELYLASGLCRVTYNSGSVRYVREYFVSAPDNVLVVRLDSGSNNAINATLTLAREKDAEISIEGGNQLVMKGQIVDESDPLRGPEGPHMRFAARLLVLTEGGRIEPQGKKLKLCSVDSATLIYTAATDYQLKKLDYDRSIEPDAVCRQIISKAGQKSYMDLKSSHILDHERLFNRVKLDLGGNLSSSIPTDDRIKALKNGKTDADLIALYFQFGRYLLMGSSRYPGVLPANLQGVWNSLFNAPWNSDFHTNINLQMNYWPAEVGNLPETVLPLTEFLNQLRVPGRVTAREMYGARGWTLHHLTDPFGRTGVADGPWGVTPLNGPWMTFPLWRHYEFTMDASFLREKAYPIMKESALFVLDFLIDDGEGFLVTAPSHSPENQFVLPSGEKSTLTYAATIDILITRALFENCIAAGDVLNIDDEFIEELKNALEKLPPVRIGKDGTIMEWIKDYEEAEPGHRHMSHLLGLYPLAQFTPRTPDLFSASRSTIQRRLEHGGGHTGWSRAWVINFFARLQDGESALKNLQALLAKSTLPNLFDTHPPFQIDGNFGGTAGIAEMLLQSHLGIIHLLPALPRVWGEGSVRGLCARGGFEVDMDWKDGELTSVCIYSEQGRHCRLKYLQKSITFETGKGEQYEFDKNLIMR